ncbi:MAG: insulinase family protein [Ardenticatenaceae bacterium]|nr:insulinase family protein [Ardenticatenaceae bacterium]HBY96191.1 insulinase family protein [Chloroflexota bacterium]
MDENETINREHSLPGPDDVVVRTLPNGLTILARENFSSPAVVASGLLRVGAQDEPEERAGLAALVASMLARGTEQRSFDEINETIEGVGGSLAIAAGVHTTRFSFKSLAEDFPTLLGVLADVVRNPTFPADHLERVRAQRLTVLRERENNTQSVAERLFYEQAYPPGHPYHTPVDGTVESVEVLTRDDVVRFYERNYEPRDAIIVVVGAIPPTEAIAQVEQAFQDWANLEGRERAEIPPAGRPAEPVRAFRAVPGKTQSDIVIGAPAVSRTDPDYLPAYVANTVLGVFGLMGRLGESVRDEQGLAYYARSSLDPAVSQGAWTATAGVAPDKVDQAVDTILTEFARLGQEPVPGEELADSKSFLTGSLPLRLETNEGVARLLLDIMFYDLGLDYLQRYAALINAIGPTEVQRVAATYLEPSAYVLAVAGPPQ